jgi:hypothetical protein
LKLQAPFLQFSGNDGWIPGVEQRFWLFHGGVAV